MATAGASLRTRPLVMAHRGGCGLWPENTVFAFERAAAMGADVLETDVRVTRDGIPILIHDPTVDRTTNGSGRVEQMFLAEVKELDAGCKWTDGRGAYPYRGRGITVPTLEEALAAVPDKRFNVDIKPRSIDAALVVGACIRRQGAGARVMVASFHAEVIDAFRSRYPEVATAASAAEVRRFYLLSLLGLGLRWRTRAQALQVPERYRGLPVLSRLFIANAHLLGLEVHVWTVKTEADMLRLISMGVDGIVTTFPDRLLRILKAGAISEAGATDLGLKPNEL